jgi:16S rRNA (cytosine967-C5)-methyltransferase
MQKVSNENERDKEIQKTARYLAVKILSRFDRSDSYLDKLLAHDLNREHLIPQDKALLTELVNGVVRWKLKIDWVLTGFYHGDYQKCLNIVKNTMRVALYQILFLNRIPVPAAIYEAVEIVKSIQGDKTASIVNGVLRNIARNVDNIRYPSPNDDEVYHISVMNSHPKWMVKRWMDRFGKEDTISLLEYNNRRPYIPVRVNSLKADVKEIEEIFSKHKVEFDKTPFFENSLLLISPKYDITASDLFKNGMITVQDPSASLTVKLAAPEENSVIYDLCAAPGGKSFLLAEYTRNNSKIIASDKHESKLRFIKEGAERLGFDNIITASINAEKPKLKEDADLILLDVPCSGLGVLSKKPDIKWKRDNDNITELVSLQRSIIDNSAQYVKPGGVLLYSTCTTEPEENEENVKWFLENHPEFELEDAADYLPKEICRDRFMYILPHLHKIDGAFAARMKKVK